MNKKSIIGIISIVLLAFAFWIGISYLDVLLNNFSSVPVYRGWNAFVIFNNIIN